MSSRRCVVAVLVAVAVMMAASAAMAAPYRVARLQVQRMGLTPVRDKTIRVFNDPGGYGFWTRVDGVDRFHDVYGAKDAVISPSGRFIAYSAFDGGVHNPVFVWDLLTGRSWIATPGINAENPVFSGNNIVFTAYATGAWELFQVPIRGGDVVAVTSDGIAGDAIRASSSLKGNVIAFEVNGVVYVANEDGSIPLSSGHDPTVSPNGAQLAFTRPTNDGELWAINTDGSGEHLLYTIVGCREPWWLPDGRSIDLIHPEPSLVDGQVILRDDITNVAADGTRVSGLAPLPDGWNSITRLSAGFVHPRVARLLAR